MTREEMKKLLPIIQEWVEGKTLEYYNTDTGEWEVVTKTIFINPNKYRIKHEPKYRPFKTKEECWNEMLKHQPFGWLKSINDESPICVGRVSWVESFEKVMITFSTNELMPFSSYSVFEGYTFADDTPFGVKI